MFRHIYSNRLKCLLREKQLLFWTLLFPLVLSLFFNLAFSNLFNGSSFKSIPVAVVDNAEYRNEKAFQNALDAESDSSGASSDKLFHVSVMSEDDAKSSLDNASVEGYILFDNGAHVVVKSSDTDQTIIKEFVDSYLEASSAGKTILSKNPNAAKELLSFSSKDYVNAKTIPNAASDGNSAYYFGLIAMAVMFGSYWGKKEIEDIQADMSQVAARINLSPVHKLKAFCYSCCASITVEFFCLLILIAFLTLVLGLDFGNQTSYIILLCFVGSIAGVSFGAFITAVIKGSAQMKHALMLALNLLLSCLAGLMSTTIKYTIAHTLPVLSYINPANLIADALYSLQYYSSYTRFLLNIGLLAGVSVVFMIGVYLTLRRQKYASL